MESGSESDSDGGIPVHDLPANVWGNVDDELGNIDDHHVNASFYPELQNRNRPRNGMVLDVESDPDPETPPGGWSFEPSENAGDTGTYALHIS